MHVLHQPLCVLCPPEEIRALLGVPKGHKLISLIAVGHPAESPSGAGKRPLKELLHWERYGG